MRLWETSKKLDTKSSHLSFQLAPSTPRTEGCGSGLLRTPDAGSKNNVASPTKCLLNGTARKEQQIRLVDQIAMLPTPAPQMCLGGAVKAIQTSTGWKRVSNQGVSHGANIHDVLKTVGKSRGLKLQPSFVEWMMGFPLGFTHIESPASRPSATPSSPKSHTKSSRRLRR